MQPKAKENLLLILKIVAAAAVFVTILLYYDTLVSLDVRALAAAAPSVLAAAGLVLCVYVLKGLVFVIPAALLYIPVGMAFSPAVALAINLAGVALEVTVSYLFGRFLGGEKIREMLSKKKGGRKILEWQAGKAGSASVFGMRLLPVFPIDFVSLFLGASRFGFWRYLPISVIGIAPRVILFTLLGDAAYDYIPVRLILILILIAVPAAAIGIVAKALYDRRRAREER